MEGIFKTDFSTEYRIATRLERKSFFRQAFGKGEKRLGVVGGNVRPKK